MKIKKRKYGITKQTTQYAIMFILGGYVFIALNWFFTNYTLRSPIILRNPVISKFVSPIPETHNKPVVMPLKGSEDKAKGKVEGNKATPSPSPKPVKKTQGTAVFSAGTYRYKGQVHVMDEGQITVMNKVESELGEPYAELIFRESGFHPQSVNNSSGACGLGQALPCEKMGCELHDVDCQMKWIKSYVEGRYGSPEAALAFHNQKGWY